MANTNLGIARVHLLSRKRQTIIAILGVTFGISMFILMISFMKGTNQFLQDAMLSSTPDINIYNDSRPDHLVSIADEYYKREKGIIVILHHAKPKSFSRNLKNPDPMITDLKKDKAVQAVSPVISSQVFFTYGAVQLSGLVDGVDIAEENKVLNLEEKMVTGHTYELLNTANGIIVGQGLANKLNMHTGDRLSVFTPQGQMMDFKVVGTFQFGVGLVDNVKAFVNIKNARQFLGKDPGYVTNVHVRLRDLDDAKHQSKLYAKKYGYKADDWATANSSIMATNIVRNVLTYVVSLALLIVAGFGIYNIMNMTIANKLKDIAILKAQGFTGKDIVGIFLSQSLLIGFIGAIAGIIVGFILSYSISRVPFPQSDLTSLDFFPVSFETKYYVMGMLFGILTTLFAGLMPALKAAKLDPVAILRG